MAWADQVAAGGFEPLRYLHASLNGERLTPGQAVQARASGLRRGVPDLFLPQPVGAFHGLFLELKTHVGRVSEEQARWHRWLAARGYAVAVCRSWVEARDTILRYLRGQFITGA